ncbi:MAG: hypothetical protein IJF74_06205, partial [Clostridia bacterium]|nr:hypothetical protein [Clostridia bacterium]
MKKAISIFLVAIMAFMLIPTFGAAAAEKVVYLSNTATGDGSSPDKTVATFADAYAAIGDDDGIIVVTESYDWAEGFTAPAHKGTITITSKYGDKDYGGEIYVLDASLTGHLICGGTTVFENITLTLTNTWVIRGNFNHL